MQVYFYVILFHFDNFWVLGLMSIKDSLKKLTGLNKFLPLNTKFPFFVHHPLKFQKQFPHY